METLASEIVSTKLQQIAEVARKHPEMVLRTLAHHIDLDFLKHAYRLTRKSGATGVDGETAEEYAAELDARLSSLLERFKAGTYRAPPVRRGYIPKDNGETRLIGIPTFEDKILQRAVTMVLEAVYEQSFLDCSYGFRPHRSAHQALEAIWRGLMRMGGGWVIEVDIKSYFDTIDHAQLRMILGLRVNDGVICRAIGKWLNAGVMEDGELRRFESGTPQGGVISPILSNIYLHEVLDAWFERDVKPRLQGQSELVRFADDFVVLVQREEDARRLLEVLPKRFAKYGLRLHPDKTRLVRFTRPRKNRDDGDDVAGPQSFDFLGFTHYWGRSRKGAEIVKRRTAKRRLARAVQRIWQWCKLHRHDEVSEQQAQLNSKLRGHYQYYGITGNFEALAQFVYLVRRGWRYWLDRRSQRARMKWARFNELLRKHPLAPPRIAHSALSASAKP